MNNPVHQRRFTGLLFCLLFTNLAYAHERWIMSEEQIKQWNALPTPELFTQLSAHNAGLISVFLLFVIGWVWLGFTGARELFPDLQARLASYGDHVPRILRVCLAWILLSSAFGAEPRFGVQPFTTPTLFAPDLYLSLLDSSWAWLQWAEVLLALTILFGIYVRVFAALLILLSLIGFYLYGTAILAYAGALIGASIYLVLQGAGRHYLPLPTLESLHTAQMWLANQPRQRAQAIMRILTGTTMLYLGVVFKLLQPNLAIGIIKMYQVPILSLAPETFALIMTLVEISTGILMIAGVLLRPLSLFLIAAFSIFALLLPETITAHILFYGVTLSCLINSAGHLRRPMACDKAANIVIVGGGLSALHAAIKIEKIIGQYSNVRITLLHEQSNFLFMPFLPEVLGGTVQPSNVVNPLRRIVQQSNVVVGRLESIDESEKRLIAKRKNGERIELAYDSLVLAFSPKSSLSNITGMNSYGYAIDSAGDVLRIRQRILELVEEAEFSEHLAEKNRLLTFAIVGTGELAAAMAVEICDMLHSAEVSYPVLQQTRWQVHLYQDEAIVNSDFEQQIANLRQRCLTKAGVILHSNEPISKVEQNELLLTNGQSVPVGLMVNASFSFPELIFKTGETLHYPFEVTDQLNLKEHSCIWMTQQTDAMMYTHRFTDDYCALGNAAGYNAWAATQGFETRSFQAKKHLIKPYNMGHYSLCYLSNIGFSGIVAWFISRLINLLAVPGLERNVRILIDWWLVIPFRSDIAVLAQTATHKLQRTQFKAGEEVYQQGDLAEYAYAVDSGRLALVQDGRKIRELGAGDYFGDISPAHQGRRTETVRCLSACELTLVAQEDVKALTQGGGLIGKAMRNLADYRAAEIESAEDLKRITYVSKLNVPLTEADIVAIGEQSSINNRKIDVTGVLISVHGYFFQILEGEQATVDKLVEKIARDSRHKELTILSAEYQCEDRYFSDWNMKTVTLTDSKDHLLQAISVMLENIAQSHSIIGHYTHPVIFKLLTEGINPLSLPVQEQERIILAGSTVNFSDIPDELSFKDVVQTINQYLEICSSTVIQYGGQFSNYSDNAMIADFSMQQADNAIAACLAIFQQMQTLQASEAVFNIIQCHFGLCAGSTLEGNIGSSVKMDYVILGCPVNEAIRLRQTAREQQKFLMVTEPIQRLADASWGFEQLSELHYRNQVIPIYALK
jgi:NADH dehydrogenase FAD-containing subunit/class 3 adenylate cyclase